MTRYAGSAQASSIDVWTSKEGLLSKVAHDLQIAATKHETTITAEDGKFKLRLVVPVEGLRVRGAVNGGATTPMSEKDHAEIEQALRSSSVLDAAKYPEIVYAAEGQCTLAGSAQVAGQLTVKGVSKPLPVRVRITQEGDGYVVLGEVRFKQSLFGMRPYSAMLGALKVKDEVRVTWHVVLKPAAILEAKP